MKTLPIDIQIHSDIDLTNRVKQVSSLFDVPPTEKVSQSWSGSLDLSDDWQIGLIVGPSGCGKTTIAEHLFGKPKSLKWGAKSVIDDFDKALSVEEIANACSSVGFNTIPSWMKPFHVLSNGEKFRVEMARLLAETKSELVVVDEFTSVVDRQVARVASYAVGKFVRKSPGRRFIAVSCHDDIVDWLQPDWIFRPETMTLERRSLQRRPEISIEISRVSSEAWRIFSKFHYLTAEQNKSARGFALWANGQLAAYSSVLHFPHPKVKDITRCSRLVTLPDWQGLGLAFILAETIGEAFATVGLRHRTYPAHPSFVRAFARSPSWRMAVKPGYTSVVSRSSSRGGSSSDEDGAWGGRLCAVFEYRPGSSPQRFTVAEAQAFLS